MNWGLIRLIWRMELVTLLRSRRTIVLSVVLPLLITPLMIAASRYTAEVQERRQESTVFRYAIAGDWSREARGLVETAADDLGRDPDSDLARFQHREVAAADPAAAVRAGEIHFYIEALGGEAADREPERPRREGAGARLDRRLEGVPVVRIFSPQNRATAAGGARRMGELLAHAARMETERLLAGEGLDIRFETVLPVEEVNVSPASATSGLFIGRFLTVLLFMLTLAGGSVVAMDIIAGEKERGTLETLLTTAAARTEIVAAKQLVILTVALVIVFLQVGNLLLYARVGFIGLPEDFAFDLGGSTAGALVLLYVPMAVLVSGALLLLSAYAKSYKEAQLYFFPLYLLGLIPAAAGAVGEIPLRSAIAVLPVANTSVAAREVLSGHTDWVFIVLTAVVNSAAAALLVRQSTRLLDDERVITARQEAATSSRTGPAAYRAQVWRWYAVMWAMVFALAAAIPQLEDPRAQVLFNEIVVFLGVPLLILRIYRLDPRRALALRLPRWPVWIATVLLIVPLHLTAGLVSRFANTVFPTPRSYLEQLAEQFSLEGIPLWQIFLLFAALPGVAEEIAFRGTLLYGLRRRFSPAALAVVVGLVFGFFHFTLFRIVTTAVLGVVITAAALATGSIFPGIVLHIGNNALAIALAEWGLPVDRLDAGIYAGGVIASGLLLWAIHRWSGGKIEG